MKKIFVALILVFCISAANADMESIKKECIDLGFKEGTQEIAKCKLELLVLQKQINLEQKKLEAAEASADAARATARATEMSAAAAQSLANSSAWRNNQQMMQKGQRMLSGRCTLGIDC